MQSNLKAIQVMQETKDNSTREKQLKKYLNILLVTIAVLLGIIVFLLLRSNKSVEQKTIAVEENTSLKSELDHLMAEYEQTKAENQVYAAQLSDRDSVISANAAEIQKLISTQADYRKIKRKLELLRGITQDYVSRIDSLVTINTQLRTENQEVKTQIHEERTKNTELSKSKQILESKVETASILKAYNLRATSAKTKNSGKETETDKASRADKINICFTLSENKIIEAGSKDIYVRIARPDGEILKESSGDDYAFDAKDGKLQYSIKKAITYNNAAQDVCLYWIKKDQSSDAMKGKYNVTVYSDGVNIGTTSFELK